MTALANVPARRIIAAIADAAARFADGDYPPRVRLLDRIAQRTGYSPPVVEYALDHIFFSLTEDALRETIAGELGGVESLDAMHEGRLALPVGRVAIISSRTTIGVAIVPAMFALAAKCDVVVKDREDALVRTFFETLAQELPECETAARAVTWNGERDEADLDSFDAVAAFGTDTTIAAIRTRMRPDAALLAYGSKASIGYVHRSVVTDEATARVVARGAARDIVLYDTEGCLSLHALFVERGGALSPQQFCALLAREIELAAVEFPPGERDLHARARVAQLRDLGAFRAAGGAGAVFSDRDASFLVLLDPPHSEPPPFAPRSLSVYSVDAPEEANGYLHAHGISIEAVAADSLDDGIVALARKRGASRVCAFGELQRPPLAHRHGGIGRIEPFVRWIGSD